MSGIIRINVTHSRDNVLASVRATLSKSSWPRVLDLLDTYGIESYERERERVQLAILKELGIDPPPSLLE